MALAETGCAKHSCCERHAHAYLKTLAELSHWAHLQEVASLYHEAFDDPVKGTSLVPLRHIVLPAQSSMFMCTDNVQGMHIAARYMGGCN